MTHFHATTLPVDYHLVLYTHKSLHFLLLWSFNDQFTPPFQKLAHLFRFFWFLYLLNMKLFAVIVLIVLPHFILLLQSAWPWYGNKGLRPLRSERKRRLVCFLGLEFSTMCALCCLFFWLSIVILPLPAITFNQVSGWEASECWAEILILQS